MIEYYNFLMVYTKLMGGRVHEGLCVGWVISICKHFLLNTGYLKMFEIDKHGSWIIKG